MRVAVFISGRGSNLKALLDASANNDAPIEYVLVLSDRAKASGLEYARAANIPVETVPRKAKERSLAEYNSALAEVVARYAPDLVILAGFMRVLTNEFIKHYEHKIINIHPSLLPDFPGLNAQQQALDAGAKVAGCTVHFVTAEVDAGPIIAQASVPVLADDDVDSLSARILTQEHQILPAAVQGIARGEIELLANGKVRGAVLHPSSGIV